MTDITLAGNSGRVLKCLLAGLHSCVHCQIHAGARPQTGRGGGSSQRDAAQCGGHRQPEPANSRHERCRRAISGAWGVVWACRVAGVLFDVCAWVEFGAAATNQSLQTAPAATCMALPPPGLVRQAAQQPLPLKWPSHMHAHNLTHKPKPYPFRDSNALLQLSCFLDEYAKLPNSPSKWAKLIDFMKGTYPAVINEVGRQRAVGHGMHVICRGPCLSAFAFIAPTRGRTTLLLHTCTSMFLPPPPPPPAGGSQGGGLHPFIPAFEPLIRQPASNPAPTPHPVHSWWRVRRLQPRRILPVSWRR